MYVYHVPAVVEYGKRKRAVTDLQAAARESSNAHKQRYVVGTAVYIGAERFEFEKRAGDFITTMRNTCRQFAAVMQRVLSVVCKPSLRQQQMGCL
jgi:hypothetical protein